MLFRSPYMENLETSLHGNPADVTSEKIDILMRLLCELNFPNAVTLVLVCLEHRASLEFRRISKNAPDQRSREILKFLPDMMASGFHRLYAQLQTLGESAWDRFARGRKSNYYQN